MAWGNCDPSWDEHEHEHELSLAWSKTQSSSNVNHITLRCHQTWFAWKSIIYRWFSHWHLHFYCKSWYKNIQHLSSSASIDTSKACLEEYLLCPRCGQGLIIGLPSAFLSRKKDVPTSYSGCWKLVNLCKSLDFFKWTRSWSFPRTFFLCILFWTSKNPWKSLWIWMLGLQNEPVSSSSDGIKTSCMAHFTHGSPGVHHNFSSWDSLGFHRFWSIAILCLDPKKPWFMVPLFFRNGCLNVQRAERARHFCSNNWQQVPEKKPWDCYARSKWSHGNWIGGRGVKLQLKLSLMTCSKWLWHTLW